MVKIIENGNPFGAHRVIEPQGVLPQPAVKVNNDFSAIWDNEMLIDVESLNIDSASFTQIKEEVGGDEKKICDRIVEIINERGKMQNPVTGSGGVLIGTVAEIGAKFPVEQGIKVGDQLVTLVSLSLTPLKITEVTGIKVDVDQVQVKGKAVLFASALYAKLPEDIEPDLAMAVLDVAGAPAQTARLVGPGETVIVIGAGGKSGILCCYEARKRAGVTGKVIGIEYSDQNIAHLESLNLCDHVLKLNAQDALTCYETIAGITDGKLADLVINCVNIPNTELPSVLMCRDRGRVYFFSMATSFPKAALGAEGVGKDVDMLVGNGYTKGHAEIAINILRESEEVRQLYKSLYA